MRPLDFVRGSKILVRTSLPFDYPETPLLLKVFAFFPSVSNVAVRKMCAKALCGLGTDMGAGSLL